MNRLLRIVSFLILATSSCIAGDPGDPADKYGTKVVSPDLSPDDANAYVDAVAMNWLSAKLPDRNPKISPQDLLKLAIAVKRLGMTNLIAVYGHTAPDTLCRVNVNYNPQDELKRKIVEQALSLSAGPNDIDALLGLYDSTPLILQVLVDHPEWDSYSKVSDFINRQLDLLDAAYRKSDLAPSRLLELAARSPDAGVQNKLDSILSDLLQNKGTFKNAHFYLNLVTVYSQTSCKIIAKHLPDIFNALAAHASVAHDDVFTTVAPADVFTQLRLADIAISQPALFADQGTKDAVNKLAEAAQDTNLSKDVRVLLPAAACGNQPALRSIADIYHDPSSTAFSHNLAKNYLTTVICQLDGDPLTQVVEHAGTALYDPVTCLWTIPKG